MGRGGRKKGRDFGGREKMGGGPRVDENTKRRMDSQKKTMIVFYNGKMTPSARKEERQKILKDIGHKYDVVFLQADFTQPFGFVKCELLEPFAKTPPSNAIEIEPIRINLS